MENPVRGMSDAFAGQVHDFSWLNKPKHQSKFRGLECRRKHFVTANPVPAE